MAAFIFHKRAVALVKHDEVMLSLSFICFLREKNKVQWLFLVLTDVDTKWAQQHCSGHSLEALNHQRNVLKLQVMIFEQAGHHVNHDNNNNSVSFSVFSVRSLKRVLPSAGCSGELQSERSPEGPDNVFSRHRLGYLRTVCEVSKMSWEEKMPTNPFIC